MEVELDIEGEKINIQCQENDSIERVYDKYLTKSIKKNKENNIIFLYNGESQKSFLRIKDIINEDDKIRKKLSIVGTKGLSELLNHRNIVCPICATEADLVIKDYKINLKCGNGHLLNDLTFSEFIEKQEIDCSKIVCDYCKKINLENCEEGKFKRCFECKQNFCENCAKLHKKEKNKKHCNSIKNYNIENFKCICHNNNIFNSYCKNCEKDLCFECRKDKRHKNHVIIDYNEIAPGDDVIIEKREKLSLTQKEFIRQIDSIIKNLNFIKNYIQSYSKFVSNVLDRYNPMEKNFRMINNIKSINLEETINDLNEVNLCDNNDNKLINIMKLYHRIKYSNELTLKYRINKKDKKVNIFGDEFVSNNEDKCKIIIENKESELKSEININDINNYNKNQNEITVILKDVNKITNMKYAFKDTSLSSISGLSKIDMSKVETMEGFFQNCIYLEKMIGIDWNIKNVKNLSYLFSGCTGIKYISFKNLNTLNTQDMSYMFHDNRELHYINGLNKLETTNVKNMECMFSECRKLEFINDLSQWKTNNLENVGEIFKGCKSLKAISDISNWDTSKLKDIHEIFYGCETVKSLPDISKWDTNNIEFAYGLFNGCSSLVSLPNISNWKINKVNNLSELFADCVKLEEIPDISSWDVSNVINLSKLFFNCLSLRFLPEIGNWKVSNVVNMNELFSKCKNLDYFPDISKWDTSNVEKMIGMFNECKKIRYLPYISHWNVKKVKEIDFMFNECSNLFSLPDINNWELNEEVKINHSIFNKCFSLISFPAFYFNNIDDNNVYKESINVPNLGINLIGKENLDLRLKRFAQQTGMEFSSWPY